MAANIKPFDTAQLKIKSSVVASSNVLTSADEVIVTRYYQDDVESDSMNVEIYLAGTGRLVFKGSLAQLIEVLDSCLAGVKRDRAKP